MRTTHEAHAVVEVWGKPDGKMPRDGRWCDDRTRTAERVYHRAPERIAGLPGEWFCPACGSCTCAEHGDA